MSTPRRAALYARISQTDENFDKVSSQLVRLREAAKIAGYEIVDEFSDDGISAFSGKDRPGFAGMLVAVRERRVDVVMAVAQDRLARNAALQQGLLAECSRAGVTIHTLNDGIFDPSQPTSKAMAGLQGVFAELDSAQKSKKVRDRFEVKAKEGLPKGGKRPFGWQLGGVEIREEEAALIRDAYDKMLNKGASQHAVAASWNAAGILTSMGKAWTSASVKDLLLRPSNAGILMVRDVRQPLSKIQPIVDEETLERFRLLVAGRPVQPGPKPKSLLAGIARCICGAPLVATSRDHGRVYRCKGIITPGLGGQHIHIARGKADRQALEGLATLLIEAGEVEEQGQEIGPLQARLSDIRATRARATRLVLAGLADEGVIHVELSNLKAEETALEDRLHRALAENASGAVEAARAFLAVEAERARADAEGDDGEFFSPSDLRAAAGVQSAEHAVERIVEQLQALPTDRLRLMLSGLADVRVLSGEVARRVVVSPKVTV